MTDIGPILPKYIASNDSVGYSLPNILIDEIPNNKTTTKFAKTKTLIPLTANATIDRKANSIIMNIPFPGNRMKITIEATKDKDLVFVKVDKNKENPVIFTGKLAISEGNKKITINDIISDRNITIYIKDNSEIEITNNFLRPRATLVLKPLKK